MHAASATPALSMRVGPGTTIGDDRQITRGEIVWLAVAALLLTMSSFDAVSEIPPLGDDYWMIGSAPGQIAGDYVRDFGWGRFIGIWFLDAINTVRAATGASLLAVIIVVRVGILAAMYFTLRRLYAFVPGVTLLAVGLMAWNPPASEAWVLLCNLHLAISVVPVIAACGLYARALGALPETTESEARDAIGRQLPWRWVTGGIAAQVTANFIYEQALLAIPAFVGVVSVLGRGRPLSRLSRVAVLAVTTVVALICGLVMVATGYVSGRAGAASAAELSDISSALRALWIGFVEHHLWRIIEVIRTHQLLWWDSSLVGAAAAMATIAGSVIIAWRLMRDRSRGGPSPNLALALAALAASYAALLPMGLAYPGYTIVARLYYLPGAFVALAVAALAPPRWRVPRLALGVAAGAAMLWLGVVTRRYYEDMRQGTRILRVVARSVARVPSAVRSAGLLVIAPSNVGTFSTSVVEQWSLRPAVRELTGIDPEGPLLMVTDCAELAHEPPRIVGDPGRPRQWARVLQYRAGSVRMSSSVAAACDG